MDSSWSVWLFVVIMALLLISGIESNPGPPGTRRCGANNKASDKQTGKQMKFTQDWKKAFAKG